MARQGDRVAEHTGSSMVPSSHNVRGSIMDRLGPSTQKRKQMVTQSAPLRRRLFTPPNSPIQETRRRGVNNPSPVRDNRDSESNQVDQREVIRRQKIQRAEEAMEALRLQQQEWGALLAGLKEGDDDPPTTIKGSREVTPQSRPRRGHVNDPPTSQRRVGSKGRHGEKRQASHRVEETVHSNSPRRRRVGSPLGDRHYEDNRRGGARQARSSDPGKDRPEEVQNVLGPVLKRMAELEQKLAEVRSNPKPTDSKSPFSPAIDQEKADPKMKLPPLESYDGMGDPFDHTSSYEIVMGYYNHSDAGMCKIFITTLKKAAKQWIVSLTSGSINSWKELRDKFHDRFGSNKKRGKLTASLMQIKQRSNETLSQYVQRFREAVGTIIDLNMTQALGFFITGLDVNRSKKLMKDVMFNPPKDLSDAYERAERFIVIEEAMSNLNQNQRSDNQPRNNETKSAVWDRTGPSANPSHSNKPPFRPKQENKVYTPLNTSMVQILEEIKGKPFFEPPQPKGHLRRGVNNVFCNYHQTAGHSTEACWDLKDLVEKKVQSGELVQYVAGQEALSPDQTKGMCPDIDRRGRPRRIID